MYPDDLYLLMPELVLGGAAGIIILLDLVLKKKDVLAPLSLAGIAASAALSLVLWLKVDGLESNALTGFNGFLVVDHYALFFKFLILGATALVLLASHTAINLRAYRAEYFALIMMASGGLMLLAASTELISIYVSLELSALATVTLIALNKDNRSTEAALKFLVLSAISSGIMLFGFAMIFGLTGSTRLLRHRRQADALQPANRAAGPVARSHLHRRRVRVQDLLGTLPNVGTRRVRRRTYARLPPISRWRAKRQGFAVIVRVSSSWPSAR